jgi:hypothetical protein
MAALSAGVVLDAGSATAVAAPDVSPFAGTYVGGDPRGWVSQWTVSVSDGGRITGVRPGFSRDKISGQVNADGDYSFSVTATIWVFARHHGHSASEPELELRTVNYKSSGNMAPDGYGNVVGTDSRGGSFVWVRQ